MKNERYLIRFFEVSFAALLVVAGTVAMIVTMVFFVIPAAVYDFVSKHKKIIMEGAGASFIFFLFVGAMLFLTILSQMK